MGLIPGVTGFAGGCEQFLHQIYTHLETTLSEPQKNTDDNGLRIAVGIVSDLCTNHPEEVLANLNLNKLVPFLGNILSREDFETQAKLRAVVAIGDIGLVYG